MAKRRVTPESDLGGASPAREPRRRAHVHQPVEASAAEPMLAAAGVSRVEIEQLAYSYWVARGGQGGSPEEDWTRAEEELRSKAS